jgi:hemerythrin-like domain-containing protein
LKSVTIPTTSVDESFGVLLRDHDELMRLFDAHQRSMLAKDIDNAVPILSKFRDDLLRHIQFEETYVLPKYAQEGGETPGGTLAIFQAEHRKLREMVDKLATETLALFTAADLDAQIIAIFDEETLFKGLLSHHTLREQNILIPRLDSRTTASERRVLLEKHAALETQSHASSSAAECYVDPFAMF